MTAVKVRAVDVSGLISCLLVCSWRLGLKGGSPPSFFAYNLITLYLGNGDSMTTANKVGRPPIEITDSDFAKMIGMVEVCCTQDEICSIFDIAESTLDLKLKDRGYDNFRDFYKKHSANGKQSLRRLQWAAAQEGNISMLIWLGKQWLGQSDKQMVDTTHTITSFEVVADEDQG